MSTKQAFFKNVCLQGTKKAQPKLGVEGTILPAAC